MATNEKFTFGVQVVPLEKLLYYGYDFRSRYFVKYEYDALSELPFMFDYYRQLVIFPDVQDRAIMKKAARILSRIINRPHMDTKAQNSDFDKLDALYGDKKVYCPAYDMFMFYQGKRTGKPWRDGEIFAYHERKFQAQTNRYYHFQKLEDFLNGTENYYHFT